MATSSVCEPLTYLRPPNGGAIVLPYSCGNVPSDFAETGEIFYEHDKSRRPLARVMEAEQNGDGIDIVAKWANFRERRGTRTVLRERAQRGKPNYASTA